jgi:hypothetical protein
MGIFNKMAAGLALAAVSAAVPAQAQTHCWAKPEATAAQVRELQTMLMVAALRCRAAHMDISADYDGFVIAQKEAIAAANAVIKAHFGKDAVAQSEYDRFTTSLANGFGDDATTNATCSAAANLAHQSSAAITVQLGDIANSQVEPVSLPGGACDAPAAPVTMALAGAPKIETAQTEPLPPILPIAPPPAEEQAVQLPADVNAALVVLAHYAQQQQAPAAPASTALAAVH